MELTFPNHAIYPKYKSKMITVFLDMDGVLADFDKRILEITGRSWSDLDSSEKQWKDLEQYQDFYRHLDQMPDASDLVNGVFNLKEVYPIRIAVLTAIPKRQIMVSAATDKAKWIDDSIN